MAIALGTNLGTNQLTGSGTTITLNVGSSVPAGHRVILLVTQFGTVSVSGASDDAEGLVWVKDYEDTGGGNNVRGCFISADAPAGLTSGGLITATYGAAASARSIAAVSFSGVTGGASGYLTGTASGTTEFGTTDWVTPSITVADNALVLAGAPADAAAGATGTVTSPATEIHDAWNASTTNEILTGYKVITTGGANTIAGTYGTAPGEQRYMVIGYTASGAAAAPRVMTQQSIPMIGYI